MNKKTTAAEQSNRFRFTVSIVEYLLILFAAGILIFGLDLAFSLLLPLQG